MVPRGKSASGHTECLLSRGLSCHLVCVRSTQCNGRAEGAAHVRVSRMRCHRGPTFSVPRVSSANLWLLHTIVIFKTIHCNNGHKCSAVANLALAAPWGAQEQRQNVFAKIYRKFPRANFASQCVIRFLWLAVRSSPLHWYHKNIAL